mgnify:CR=1 FL=1
MTYGITSCLYLGAVLAVRLLVSENPALAASIFYLSIHFVSGMDTAFALGYLTGYINLCRRHDRCSSPGRVLWMGIWGGGFFRQSGFDGVNVSGGISFFTGAVGCKACRKTGDEGEIPEF